MFADTPLIPRLQEQGFTRSADGMPLGLVNWLVSNRTRYSCLMPQRIGEFVVTEYIRIPVNGRNWRVIDNWYSLKPE